MKKTLGVNPFDSKKTSRRFSDIIAFLPEKQKDAFVAEVNALFDKKITSEEGEYAEFKVTESDLTNILKALRENIA